jgi:hypothetical protein
VCDLTAANAPHLVGIQGNERYGFPIQGDKFNFITLTLIMNQNHRSHITGLQTMFRQIDCQHNSLQFLNHPDFLSPSSAGTR